MGGGGHLPVFAEDERVVLGAALARCGPRGLVGSRSFEAIKASFRNTDRAHSTADRGCCCTGESGTKEVLPGGCGRGSYELLLRWWAARLGAACESVKSLMEKGRIGSETA